MSTRRPMVASALDLPARSLFKWSSSMAGVNDAVGKTIAGF